MFHKRLDLLTTATRSYRPVVSLLCLLIVSIAGRTFSGAAEPKAACVGDRLWVWAYDVGVYNGAWACRDLRASCLWKAAQYLGVNNLILIRYQGKPAPPFEEYARPFQSLQRVMWSVTGASGTTSAEERRQVLALARHLPNVTGVFMDDFFHVSDPSDAHWLAQNDVKFPVTLTLALPAKATADRVQLVQSRWSTGDYRTADFEVEASEDGQVFRRVGRSQLPNRPGAGADLKLPPGKLSVLRLTILGTHDRDKARSCGLSELHLINGAKEVTLEGAKLTASSEYPGHPARMLLGPGNSSDEPAPAALTVAQLRELRKDLQLPDRRLDLGVTLYTHQLHANIRPHLELCDLVSLWTWRAADLRDLDETFRRFEKVVPNKRRLLGLYLWDFGTNHPMPLDLMKHQCALGLKWLQEDRVEGLILLGTNLCDLNLETVTWARKWVSTVAKQPLQGRR